MVEIIPNITTSDLDEAREKLKKLQKTVKKVHFDIIDAFFATTQTVNFRQLSKIKLPEDLDVCFHLMVGKPSAWIKKLSGLGAKQIIGQIEMMDDQEEFVNLVRAEKMRAGLALDEGTPSEKIKPRLLPQLATILVMTVKAGWKGRRFKKEPLAEVRKLRNLQKKNGYQFKIAVDGGVNEKTIPACVKAGAQLLFIHTAIWKAEDINRQIEALNKIANQ